jgi:Leucine-rich repeat (LRR) protein
VVITTRRSRFRSPTFDAGINFAVRVLPTNQVPRVTADDPTVIEALKEKARLTIDDRNSVQEVFFFKRELTRDELIEMAKAGKPWEEEVFKRRLELTDDDLRHVAKFTNLRRLDAGKTTITEAQMAHLQNLDRLTYLDLSLTEVGDAGLRHLRTLNQLETIKLSGKNLTDTSLEILAEMKQLELLQLGQANLSREAAWRLQQTLPDCLVDGRVTRRWGQLRDPTHNWRPIDVATKTDQQHRALARLLVLGAHLVVDENFRLVQVRTLNLGRTKAADFVQAITILQQFPSVEHLDLRQSRFQEKDLAPLARLPNLKQLILRNCDATDTPYRPLGELTQLEHLELGGSDINDAGLSHLRRLINLRYLDLGQTHITDAGLAHLREMPQLEELYLSPNWRITDAGLAHLSRLTNLRRLTLPHRRVTEAGVAPLLKLPHLTYIPGWEEKLPRRTTQP